MAKDFSLYQKVLREISEYTQEDFSIIEDKYRRLGEETSGKDFDTLGEEQLKQIYINDEHSLYYLPFWNAKCGRNYYLSWLVVPYLKKNGYKDILDFGAGTGDFCIILAEEGFNTYYTDISTRLIDFSRWRFQKRGLSIKIIEEGKLGKLQFDCVLSFDVFEHLKNLPQKLKDLSSLIRNNGSLIFNIELSGDGLHLQENKAYSNENVLDKALRQAGFTFDWRFKKFMFYRRKACS